MVQTQTPPYIAPQVVMQLVDSMVKRTNEQLNESTSLLQDILKAAADPQVRLMGGWVGCTWHRCGRKHGSKTHRVATALCR